jgi:hypothetical protein
MIALLFSVLAGTVHFGTVQAATDVSGIPKPSVPEFTVKLVAHPYDVPTTYSIDPYTGETITHAGYHVENKSIEVSIKNQPFTPYTDTDGKSINLYYNVRVKGHFEENWTELFSASGEYPSAGSYPKQDYGSQYTIVFYPRIVPSNGQMDFQVEALVGYYTRVYLGNTPAYHDVFTGESSGWSNTQTLTISASQTPTPSPATTPTPTAPNMGPTSSPSQEPALTQEQLEIIIGAAIAAAVIVAGLVLLIYLSKRK